MSVREKVTQPGDVTGNLSESGRVVINVVMNAGDKITYNWFVKIMPKQHKNSDLINEFDIPKLLFAANKEEGAIIVLEDVSEQGYCQERDPQGGRYLSVEKAKLAIDAIARIQAASKLYNVHHTRKLEEKHVTLCHKTMWEDTEFLDRLSAMKDCYCEVLKRSSEADSPVLVRRFQKVFNSRPRLISVCAERYNPKKAGAIYLQHGDFHYNNLLFKEEENKPKKVMIVDWQFTYTGRSTGDVSYLLLSSISPEVRHEHEQELKEAYFNSFNNYLKTFEASVNDQMYQDSSDEDSEDSDVEVDVQDLEHDYHDSTPLSLFLSCGNVLSSDADKVATPDISDDDWEMATVSFAYNLVKEAAEMKFI